MSDSSSLPNNQNGVRTSQLDFKEIITALIALAIVGTLIGMLWVSFNKTTTIDEKKYLIGIILSLAGTVTGYYFGRVPAEKRADTAEKAADDAKSAKAKTDAKLDDTKKTLDSALSEHTLFKSQAAGTPLSDTARQELEDLRQRLS